ncbi:MAG: hypothetical protein IV100_03635 [Myxococcales bacterium]|nr:hypothetical protein [Myxococcales bacterium]
MASMTTTRLALAVTSVLSALGVGCGDGQTIVEASRDATAIIPEGENRAPFLHKVGDRVAVVGQPLRIELRADDADGDTLSFSAHSLPKGATFDRTPPVLIWTPTVIGDVVSPTFVVSDGKATDRETVRIEVVSQAQNHAPRFQKIGDQAVEVSDTLSLLLQAVDADGDTLTFGIEGTSAPGTKLEAATGRFTWTPPPTLAGTQASVTFSVTDSKATDTMSVSFFILAPGQNRPPVFLPLPLQVAEVGTSYELVLQAIDPEGDPLVYSTDSVLPSAASFDPGAARFRWTPGPTDAGTTATFVFAVSDGNYRILTDVDIDVLDPDIIVGSCKDDFNEPNNTSATATALTVGDYENLSLCDTTSVPIDVDWFRIALAPGQTLSITLDFEHDDGDLDLALFAEGDTTAALAVSDSATDQEVLVYTADKTETVLVKIFGTGQSVFQSLYTMVVSTGGLDCDDDDREPNDTKLQPAALPASGDFPGLMFCPADLDFYEVELTCGQIFSASLTYTPEAGDLELALYRESNLDTPVAISEAVGGTEAAFYEAPRSESLIVLVRGVPSATTLSPYSLATEVSSGTTCVDDAEEPNDDRGDASLLTPPADELQDLLLCCNEDWFYVPLKVGDGAVFEVRFPAGADVKAELYTIDDDEPLVVGEPDTKGLLVSLDSAPFSGNFYLRVEGPAGTALAVEMVTFESEGCESSKACDPEDICWIATGACVSAYCFDEEDCPLGQDMPCHENQCLAGCTYEGDCKLGWSCKGYDFGTFCGPSGTGASGAACAVAADCDGAASCTFPGNGGYCGQVGCKSNPECPSDASCVQLNSDQTLCAKKCVSNGDCRAGDGYTCQPKVLPNGLPTTVCLPPGA